MQHWQRRGTLAISFAILPLILSKVAGDCSTGTGMDAAVAVALIFSFCWKSTQYSIDVRPGCQAPSCLGWNFKLNAPAQRAQSGACGVYNNPESPDARKGKGKET